MEIEKLKLISQEQGLAFKMIVCEFIQAVFLDCLYTLKESEQIYFHGGTSLRFLHQSYRFSEDLDFACPHLSKEKIAKVIEDTRSKTKKILIQFWGPLETELKTINQNFPVLSWWFNVQHPTERGKFKVKLEIGQFPVHLKKLFPLESPSLPLSFHPLVVSQDLTETFADKVNAMAQRNYTKGRDFFDLWYLLRIKNVKLDLSLIQKKFSDYRAKEPLKKLEEIKGALPQLEIGNDLDRFLPRPYWEKLSPKNYALIREAVSEILLQVLKI